jgi:polysaccharide chain length determinant protein (PEP-CTERM system associated)
VRKLLLTDPFDYLAILVRRKWWLIIPCLSLLLPLLLLVYQLPDVYISEASILVEPKEPTGDSVRNPAPASPEQRMAAIHQEMLSRPNLQRLIEEFGNELEHLNSLTTERQIEVMRKQVSLGPAFARHRQDDPGFAFRISCQSRDPALAQRILSRLSTLFVEQNGFRETQGDETRQFLESELQRVGRQLDETDNRLRQIREQYRHEFPGQLQSNPLIQQQLQNQRKANREALDRYESLRLSLQRQIAETPAQLAQPATAHGGNPVLDEYSRKTDLLRELSTRYTEQHPDIQRLRAEIEQLRAALPPGALAAPDAAVSRPNPVHANLTRQLEEVESEIRTRGREDLRLEGEIQRFARQTRNSPLAEQAIAPLERTRVELARQYQDLNNRLAQALLSRNPETQQRGDRFIVYEPASLPGSPSKPNRLFLLALVLFLSLGVGLGTALAVDFTSQKLWTQSEVEKLLGVPVLVEIPEILTEEEDRTRKRKHVRSNLLFLSVLLLLTGAMAALTFSGIGLLVVERTAEFLGWY